MTKSIETGVNAFMVKLRLRLPGFIRAANCSKKPVRHWLLFLSLVNLLVPNLLPWITEYYYYPGSFSLPRLGVMARLFFRSRANSAQVLIGSPR